MPPGLASALLDLLALRRQQALRWRWPEVPEWVFCSEPEHVEGKKEEEREGGGDAIDERNFERSWQRVRRRAHKAGVRPLKLHWRGTPTRAARSQRGRACDGSPSSSGTRTP